MEVILHINSAGKHSSPETSMRKGCQLELLCLATQRLHSQAGITTVLHLFLLRMTKVDRQTNVLPAFLSMWGLHKLAPINVTTYC